MIHMIDEKRLFFVSIAGFSGLLILQAGFRVAVHIVNAAGLAVIGAAMGFCAVGAATAYRLVTE